MTEHADITVIIPSIPPRASMLARALTSVTAQHLHPAAVHVELDPDGTGPAATRNRALEEADTGWVAFLDDDDELLPTHLQVLWTLQQETGADVCWPWFQVVGGTDPFPTHRGRQWDPDRPHQIPITTLVRAAAIRAVGGFRTIGEGPTDSAGNRAGEDFELWKALSAAGYTFAHTPEITWRWHHHGRNTSGLPSRWRR